jgi:hypothetical protein
MSKIEELRARLKADPGSRHFYYLGEELRKAGQHQEAIEVLRQGLAGQPAYASAWIGLGRTLKELGQHQEAIESLKKGLELDPSNAVPARLLAESYLAIGDKLEAIKKFKFFNAVMPGDDAVEEVIERLERELAAPAAEMVHPETVEVSSDDAASMDDGELIDETSGGVAWSGADELGAAAAEASAEPREQNDTEPVSSKDAPHFEEEQPFDVSSEGETGDSSGVLWGSSRSDLPEEPVFEDSGLASDRPFDQPAAEEVQDEQVSAVFPEEPLSEYDEDDPVRTAPFTLHQVAQAESEPPPAVSSSVPVDDPDVRPERSADEPVNDGYRSEPPTFAPEGSFAPEDSESPAPIEQPSGGEQESNLAEVIAWPARSDASLAPEVIGEPEREQRFDADRSSDESDNAAPLSPQEPSASASDPGSRKKQVVNRLENWLSVIRRERDV